MLQKCTATSFEQNKIFYKHLRQKQNVLILFCRIDTAKYFAQSHQWANATFLNDPHETQSLYEFSTNAYPHHVNGSHEKAKCDVRTTRNVPCIFGDSAVTQRTQLSCHLQLHRQIRQKTRNIRELHNNYNSNHSFAMQIDYIFFVNNKIKFKYNKITIWLFIITIHTST